MNTQVQCRYQRAAFARCAGLTLVEVLIALLVMSVGILGLATLQTSSINFNAEANRRTQATILAYEMADRMRANRPAALGGAYTIAIQNPIPACAPPSIAGNVATQDISAWRSSLVCRLPSGTGSIALTGTVFTLTVQWDDSHGQNPPQPLQVTTEL